ncbi:MAG: carboxypeptidase regulatory-like domain-containing protein [Planctomycetota bacterium]
MSIRLLLAVLAAVLAALWLASLGSGDPPNDADGGRAGIGAARDTNEVESRPTGGTRDSVRTTAHGDSVERPTLPTTPRARDGLTLRGRIVDHVGQPIASAAVVVRAPWTAGWLADDSPGPAATLQSVVTFEDGRFLLELPARALYLLSVEAPRRPTVYFDLLGPSDAGEIRDLGDLRVDAGFGLVLDIQRADRAEPIANARVLHEPTLADPFLGGSAPRRTALSDARGRAILYGIPVGDGRIRVEADGYATTEHEHHHAAGADAAARLTIALEPGHSVGGRILSAESQAVVDARVVLVTTGARTLEIGARSASDGSFLLLGVPSGAARLHVEPPAGTLPVSLEVTVPLRERIEVRLSEGAVIEGVVVDAVTQLPVGDAKVRIARSDGAPIVRGRRLLSPTTTTGRDGRFRFRGLDAGSFRVDIASDRHRSTTGELVAAPPPTSSPTTLAIRPAPRVRVHVTDHLAQPIAGAVIETLPADFDGSALAAVLLRARCDAARSATTDAEGNADLLLDRDATRLSVRAAGLAPHITAVLQPVESVDPAQSLTIALEPGARIVGRCRDADGRAVGAVLVRLEATGGGTPRWFAETTSAPDGSYALGPVAPGNWQLLATPDFGRAATTTESTVELAPGAERLLELQIR